MSGRTLQQASLFWGVALGITAAALSILSLALGDVVAPLPRTTTASTVVVSVFIRGLLVYVALGVSFGLAYFAGLRVAKDITARRASEHGGVSPVVDAQTVTQDRLGSAFAGGLVMLLYSLVYTVLVFVFPANQPNTPKTQTNMGQFLAIRLAFAFFFVLFGAGLGGLGARSLQSRRMLSLLNIAPAVSPVLAQPPYVAPPVAAAASTPVAEPASSAQSEADTAPTE
ncbi:MAG TPA: hypothetical protein VF120_15035 [Ktedonobacterales bacterium]